MYQSRYTRSKSCGARVAILTTQAPVAPDHTPTSPIAPAHKRARSVDTGKATQQRGPPAKLPKSRSVENLVSASCEHHFQALQTTLEKKWTMVSLMNAAHHHLPKLDLSVVPLHRLPNQATLEGLRASSRRTVVVKPPRVSS